MPWEWDSVRARLYQTRPGSVRRPARRRHPPGSMQAYSSVTRARQVGGSPRWDGCISGLPLAPHASTLPMPAAVAAPPALPFGALPARGFRASKPGPDRSPPRL